MLSTYIQSSTAVREMRISKLSAWSSWPVAEGLTSPDEGEQDGQLVDRVSEYVFEYG